MRYKPQTVTFTTVRCNVTPTAEGLGALLPILQSVKEAGAGDRFPMEIILHVTGTNYEQVKQVIAELERAGFISNLKMQQMLSEVKNFVLFVYQ